MYTKIISRFWTQSGFLADIFEKAFGLFERWHWKIAYQLDNDEGDDPPEDGKA